MQTLTLEQIFDPTLLNGQPFDSTREDFGPVYPALPGLDKYRRKAARGEETLEDAKAYGRAVGEAIRRINTPKARWCWKVDLHYDTAEAHAAQMRRDWESSLRADRAARTDEDIREAYESAMNAKRARQAKLATMAKLAEIAPEKNGDLIKLFDAPGHEMITSGKEALPTALAHVARLDLHKPASEPRIAPADVTSSDDLARLADDGGPDPEAVRRPAAHVAARSRRPRKVTFKTPAPVRFAIPDKRGGIQWRAMTSAGRPVQAEARP